MKRGIILFFVFIQFANLFGQTCSPDSLMLRSIKAFDTDNNIDDESQEHQVFINPDCIQNNKLVLHLIGSFDDPVNTSFFPTLAANNGFKVIVLKYPNNIAAASACADSNNPFCFQNFREEIVYGTNSSNAVNVDESNSILNRFEKLLSYLDNSFPTESWGDFLTPSENINWSNILISGHSQGGGHAAFIAKQFDVNRALMFAAPNDFSDFFGTPANWVSAPGTTPDSNYYAFGNFFDNAVDFEKQFAVWNDMNLLSLADSTNVDQTTCNYNNSRILYTKFSSLSGIGNHSSLIIDNLTPISAGIPTFTPVWEYMLGVCEITTLIAEINNTIFDIKLFPNPTSSKVFIESKSNISTVEVFDLTGTLLKRIQPFQKSFHLNIESFKGVVLIKMTLEDSQNTVSKKVFVK